MLRKAETPLDSNGLELGAVSTASPREQVAAAQAGVIANLEASAERRLRDLNATCDALRELDYPGGDDNPGLGAFFELRANVGLARDLARQRKCSEYVIKYLQEALTFPKMPPKPTSADKLGALKWSIDQAAWMLETGYIWDGLVAALDSKPPCIPTFDPPALVKHALKQLQAALDAHDHAAAVECAKVLRAALGGRGAA